MIQRTDVHTAEALLEALDDAVSQSLDLGDGGIALLQDRV